MIGDDGAFALSEALKVNNTITVLNLSSSHFANDELILVVFAHIMFAVNQIIQLGMMEERH